MNQELKTRLKLALLEYARSIVDREAEGMGDLGLSSQFLEYKECLEKNRSDEVDYKEIYIKSLAHKLGRLVWEHQEIVENYNSFSPIRNCYSLMMKELYKPTSWQNPESRPSLSKVKSCIRRKIKSKLIAYEARKSSSSDDLLYVRTKGHLLVGARFHVEYLRQACITLELSVADTNEKVIIPFVSADVMLDAKPNSCFWDDAGCEDRIDECILMLRFLDPILSKMVENSLIDGSSS